MTTVDPETLPYRPCVGLILLNTQGLIFVGERLDTPGAWQMPQGGIDDGETPLEAGLRELEEETGITPNLVSLRSETADWVYYDLPPDRVGRAFGGRYRGQKQKWFTFDFSGADSDVQIETAHPEFSCWKWMNAAAIMETIVPFKQGVYQQVLAAHL